MAWQPDDWAALGTWATVLVAVVAGVIAWRQVREARRLREETAQPYVVAFMEPHRRNPQFIDLVIKNLGNTAAVDVRVAIAPNPRQSNPDGTDLEVWIPECIPLLVPGQEWRSLWDFSPHRAKSELPERHEATIAYKDSRGRSLEQSTSMLDWRAFKGRMWVETYDVHEVAKALRDMNKTTKKWTNSLRGGLAVYSRDGDAHDKEQAARVDEMRRRAAEYETRRQAQLAAEAETERIEG